MKYISNVIMVLVVLVSLGLASATSAKAQDEQSVMAPIADVAVSSQGRAPLRTEFISYDTRDAADERDLVAANYYLPLDGNWRVKYINDYQGSDARFAQPEYSVAGWSELKVPSVLDRFAAFEQVASPLTPPQLPQEVPMVQYRAEIMVPILWLDRQVYIHIEQAVSAFTLYVQGKKVGFSNDSRTPAEFNITPYLDEGPNSICIEVYGYSTGDYLNTENGGVGSLGNVYVYSQPSIRIADYLVRTIADSAWRDAVLNINVILKNEYNYDETVKVGYDIYGPDGKLKMYNLTDVKIKAFASDTLLFDDNIMHVIARTAWSPQSPTLYNGMLYVRRGQRVTEYIPFRVGFAESEFKDGVFYHNRKPVELNVVAYDAEATERQTEATLRKIKQYGKNAVCPSYPQPMFYYELCDKVGLFVIDQANVNCWYDVDNLNVGGSIVNNPQWQTAIRERVRAMYERTKNSTSVIARSMGGHSGNGYNMYKSYLELKSIDSLSRIAVTYQDLRGEWNRDFEFPSIISKSKLFASPLPSRARRR